MSRHLSVRFTLLDQQIVDVDGRRIGRVDDLEWHLSDSGGDPEITHLLTGAEALGKRLGRLTGAVMARVSARLRHKPFTGPTTIPASVVADHEDLVRLRVPFRDLPQVAGLERWLATHLIGHLPGAGDADQ